MLMKAGDEIPKRYDLSSLRYTMSVGEPLNPEAVVWGERVLGLPFHDNWWQTETGSIMIANYPVHGRSGPARMGRPIPGIEPGIIDDDGNEVPPGEEGDLAVRPGWPSMFRTYWNDEERYNSRFQNGWYITGDRARMDADGYFWFVGRADDVINTAGHLVGPFEVESALIEHPAVAEAGVIGKPDPVAMEIVKAFVSLKDGYEPSDQLRRELIRLRARQARPRRRPARDRLPRRRCRRRAPARSCAASSRPASSACPRATRARSKRTKRREQWSRANGYPLSSLLFGLRRSAMPSSPS